MIRKQIYIEERQQETIRRLASSRGVSEAEVIRQAVDVHGSQASPRGNLDAMAWGRALKIMRSTQVDAGLRTGGIKRWDRDALYEGRLNRYGRSPR